MNNTQTPAQRSRVIVIINTLGTTLPPTLSRWLARASVARTPAPSGIAERLLRALGVDHALESPAALRFAGQTGQRPDGFIAAADPVYLEPRLDHLCLHSLSGRLRDGELSALVAHLNECLGDTAGFDAIGDRGYLRSDAFPVAEFDADALHGFVPNPFLPSGDGAADYRRLQSEIEMALHDHPVNLERQRDGLQPVNSLWIWGGGEYSNVTPVALPPLLGDDPLLRGLWAACGADSSDWPGSMASADGRGVVVVPESDDKDPAERLDDVRRLFASGAARTLDILTRDGVDVRLHRLDRLKFWRRTFELPEFAP